MDNKTDEQFVNHSPLPESTDQVSLKMTFPDALREILNGKRITRLSWDNLDEFGCLHESYLTVHTKGEYHQWMVNDGDLNAIDWVVIPDGGQN